MQLCTFRKGPSQPRRSFHDPDEVLMLAERAARPAARKALFSLGDQPEKDIPEAREFLSRQGYSRNARHLAAMCELVSKKTGLLPHANPGLMTAPPSSLKDSNASVGLMLENVSPR